MKTGEDPKWEHLEELIEKALRGLPVDVPPVMRPASLTANSAFTMGATSVANGVIGSVAAAMNQQVATQSGAGSWLKWLNPIAGLASLFTGRAKERIEVGPALLPRPPKRFIEYGLISSEGGVLSTSDRDERGRVRMLEPQAQSLRPVVVQVQAMDSRSFIDHRDEIASAVRQALMESHGLGSILGEFQE